MLKKKIKIIFFLPHLKAGGAERVVSFIFKCLDRTLFEPYLIVLGFEKEAQYTIIEQNIIFLNKKRLRSALLDIVIKIRQLKPAIVFGSIGHINVYLGFLKFLFPKIKFIAREASVYTKMKYFNTKKQLPFTILNRLYQKLDAIVYQSGDMKKDFQDTFSILPSAGYLIYNPITYDSNKYSIASKPKTSPYKFIIVGSLVVNKGHNRIFELFKRIQFNFVLEVVGDGPLRKELEEKSKALKLENKVVFRGLQKDMEAIYASADFLIQGSYVEGFPNVVLEALSFGIPCVVYNAPGGHKEMIIENENGYVIHNEEEAPKIIEKTIHHHWDRNAIQKDAYYRFGSEKITRQYETLFQKIVEL